MRPILARIFEWVTEAQLCPCGITANIVYRYGAWPFNRLPRRYSLTVSGIGAVCCEFLIDRLYPDKED